jgi:hypothetical protein
MVNEVMIDLVYKKNNSTLCVVCKKPILSNKGALLRRFEVRNGLRVCAECIRREQHGKK